MRDDGARTVEERRAAGDVGGGQRSVCAGGDHNLVLPGSVEDDERGAAGDAIPARDSVDANALLPESRNQLVSKRVVPDRADHRDRVTEASDGAGLVRPFAPGGAAEVFAHDRLARRGKPRHVDEQVHVQAADNGYHGQARPPILHAHWDHKP